MPAPQKSPRHRNKASSCMVWNWTHSCIGESVVACSHPCISRSSARRVFCLKVLFLSRQTWDELLRVAARSGFRRSPRALRPCRISGSCPSSATAMSSYIHAYSDRWPLRPRGECQPCILAWRPPRTAYRATCLLFPQPYYPARATPRRQHGRDWPDTTFASPAGLGSAELAAGHLDSIGHRLVHANDGSRARAGRYLA